MKMIRMFMSGIRDAFKSVYRNFSLSVASISAISITLFVVAIGLLASFNVKNFSNNIKSDVTMVVFLNLGVTEEDIVDFERDMMNESNVSPDWEKKTPTQRKEELKQDEEFWNSIAGVIDNEEEIFRYSYLIKVNDIEKIKETATNLKKNTSVESIDYGESTVEKMIAVFDIVEKIVIVVIIILIIVTIFLIVNTIKLTIFSRKREIMIMRVVGASNWRIKNPFIFEGLIIGMLGSLIPIIITIYGYTTFYDSLDNGKIFGSFIELIKPSPFVYHISLLLLLIGMVVGMFGSGRAVRKHLKV